MGGKNKHILEVGRRRSIGDDTPKRDLLVIDKAAKAQRVSQCALDRRSRDATRPIGVLGKKSMNHVDIEIDGIIRDAQDHGGEMPG